MQVTKLQGLKNMKANKKDVNRQLKIAKGQLEAVLKMVDDDRYCIDISTQLLAIIALLKKTNQQVLAAHIRSCVKEALESGDSDEKLEEALCILEKLNK